MSRPVLLDTCAAIWLMDGALMSAASRETIRQAQIARAGIFVSPITAWEIATLLRKKRITLNRSPEIWVETLLGLPGVRLASLSPSVLIASALLPGDAPADPADRIIAATARTFCYTVITRDGELVPYGAAGHIAVTAC
nr:type II toxin-antitoxin system VapC family toxin [uncultured Rhodopila sp.]